MNKHAQGSLKAPLIFLGPQMRFRVIKNFPCEFSSHDTICRWISHLFREKMACNKNSLLSVITEKVKASKKLQFCKKFSLLFQTQPLKSEEIHSLLIKISNFPGPLTKQQLKISRFN